MLRSILTRSRVSMATGAALGLGAAGYMMSTNAPRLRNETQGALDPQQWTPLAVHSEKYISHDTKEIVLHLPDEHTIGGKTAYCVLFKTKGDDGKPVIRPYTPTSDPESVGSATFVIKHYENGKMTTFLHGLKSGDPIEVKGPIQKYEITPNKHKSVTLIGGGTGITPLYQVLQEIAKNQDDKTKVTLIYGSQSPDDVLLKSEIDTLIAKRPGQFKVHYFVDKDDKGSEWKGEVGYITKDFLQKNIEGPKSDNTHVFVCGPPPLMNAISGNKKSPSDQGELTGALKELGYSKDQVFKF